MTQQHAGEFLENEWFIMVLCSLSQKDLVALRHCFGLRYRDATPGRPGNIGNTVHSRSSCEKIFYYHILLLFNPHINYVCTKILDKV